jgi:hypothetical protein
MLCRTQKERNRFVTKWKREPKTHYLMTTRFNNNTHDQMMEYCSKSAKIRCAYGSFTRMASYLPQDVVMFVLEMNNDKNKIMGIGMIRNTLSTKQHFVYNEDVYNTFTYIGSKRIDRTEMTEIEEGVMEICDKVCFKGVSHQKRHKAITVFPVDVHEKYKEDGDLDLTEFVRNMFLQRL